MLDLTSERIIAVHEDMLINFTDAELLDIQMTFKYGMDGSTGNAEYNQVFDNDDGTKSDASLVMSCLVPIKATSKEKVLFQNPRPSSTRLCRPIHIQMTVETTELVHRKRDYLAGQIKALKPTELEKYGRKMRISYQMLLTMVDSKVCSALTDTKSSARCYICKATPKQMNNIQQVQTFKIDEAALAASSMHG